MSDEALCDEDEWEYYDDDTTLSDLRFYAAVCTCWEIPTIMCFARFYRKNYIFLLFIFFRYDN